MTQCQCSMRIRLVGDGCRYCQPQEYIDRLHDSAKGDSAEIDALTARVAELEAANARLKRNVVHMESVLHSIIHEAKVHVADGAWEMAQYLDRIRSIAVGAVGNHPAPLLSGKERSNADQA